MVGFWHWHIPTFIITDISPPWWDFVMVVLCWVPMMMMMMMITLVLIRILGRTPHLIHPARTPSPTLHLYSTVHQNQESRIYFPIWWWCTVCIFFMKFKTLSTAHCGKAVECAPDCVSPNAPSCTSEKNTKLRQIQGIEHSSSNSLPLPNDFARKYDNILPIN